MADAFPDVTNKLGAPTKKSLFERQKAEAEAKKARADAETAAVYEDFVKSFDDEAPAPVKSEHGSYKSGGLEGPRGGGAPGKRHFTGAALKSGPGSLEPSRAASRSGTGSYGSSQPAFGRKRPFDDFAGDRRDGDRSHGMFSYEDDRPDSRKDSRSAEPAFKGDDEEAKAAPKPTLHLSSLPPRTSPAVIKALIPSMLTVENVRIMPPSTASGPNSTSTDRRSGSAIVSLAADTPATDIDTIVSQLQNRYLGFGFYLSISRHLSSAALSAASAITAPTSNTSNLPFGAKPIVQQHSLSRAPPPGHRGGFAPPASFTSSTPYGQRNNMSRTEIHVQPPKDLVQLKLIHKTLESLLTHGPEFEALLMSRQTIQMDEKWAWLWDSRSTAGVYYRWRLWDILTDGPKRRRQRQARFGGRDGGADEVFVNGPTWLAPEAGALRFEYTTRLDELISDEDYDSSDEEDGDADLSRRYNDHKNARGPPQEVDTEGVGYLNPLQKAKLVHLLKRLPDSNAKVRKGDVARVTAFAIEHAGAGAAEVVELVCRNVVRPFCHSTAKAKREVSDEDTDDAAKVDGKPDTTPASLVALYIISDILSSSSTSGVRHAWRYRALFETALQRHKTFERLGRLEKELGWGKLRAEKWKRSVLSLLGLWEGWCVFPQGSHEELVTGFVEPPLSGAEKEKLEREEKGREAEFKKGKWKSVQEEEGGAATPDLDADAVMRDAPGNGEELDGYPMSDIDGEPMTDSNSDEKENGDDNTGDHHSAETSYSAAPETEPKKQSPQAARRHQRPKAVDMFADESGGED